MENIDYETLHKYSQQVYKAAGFASQTSNEVVKFIPIMKIIYLTMLNEKFNCGGELKMSQQKLADTICVDRKTASRTLLSLVDHGVLLGEKRVDNERGFSYWVYSDIMFPLELEYGEGCSKDMVRRGRKGISQRVRFEVLRRNKFCCSYCGKAAVDGYRLVIDHIKPVSKGGTNDIDNLTASCDDCNNGKGTADIDSYTTPVFSDKETSTNP